MTSLPKSHWLDSLPEPGEQIDPEDRSFEYIIIGGGYTGLSAARTLAAAGKEVAVLEQRYCGYGASARNAGHLTPTIGKDVPTLLLLYGEDTTRELIRFGESAVEYTEQLIRDTPIDCDYVPHGNLMAAVTEGQLNSLRKAYKKTEQMGVKAIFLEPEDAAERDLPHAFLGGTLELCGGGLHPGKYLIGLKDLAIAAGANILEYVNVGEISRKQRYVIKSSAGMFQSDKLIIATNAFRPLHRYLKIKSVPLSVSLLETEPLSDAQLQSIGWKGKEGIYTAHEILESYRLTAQNTIVAGSKTVTYRRGYDKVGLSASSDADTVRKAFYSRFPELTGIGIKSEWSGPILFTLDFLPMLKELEPGLFSALAYAGHGVAMATYCGKLIAEMALGDPMEEMYLSNRNILTIPPEPFRTLTANSLIGILSMVDAFADRKASGR